MNAEQRLVRAEEAVDTAELVRKRIGNVTDAVDHLGDRSVDLPARHGAGGRIDGDGTILALPRTLPGLVLIVEQLVIGMCELLLSLELPHLPREDPLPTDAELTLTPRLTEEGEIDGPLAVADDHLQQ